MFSSEISSNIRSCPAHLWLPPLCGQVNAEAMFQALQQGLRYEGDDLVVPITPSKSEQQAPLKVEDTDSPTVTSFDADVMSILHSVISMSREEDRKRQEEVSVAATGQRPCAHPCVCACTEPLFTPRSFVLTVFDLLPPNRPQSPDTPCQDYR